MAEEIEVSTEMHVLDKVLDEEELDQNMSIGEQEFGEIERGKDELKDKKVREEILHLISHKKHQVEPQPFSFPFTALAFYPSIPFPHPFPSIISTW